MIKQVVAFGDSWTYGDELLSPETLATGQHVSSPINDEYRLSNGFPGQVAKYYEVPLVNLGSNGGTLQSMVWEFTQWLHNTEDFKSNLLLIGLTHHSRMSFWDNSNNSYHHSGSIINSTNIDFKEIYKLFLTKSNCYQLEKLNYQSTVHLFQFTCRQLGIPHVIFNIFSSIHIPFYTPLIEEGMYDWIRAESNRLGKEFIGDCHPTAEGHAYIASWLINHITVNQILNS